MLISIQFPIADSRGFVSNTGRLLKPGWPLPTPDEEFVRSYGPIRIRPRGGLSGWVGENEICEASRAVRLSRSLSITSRSPAATLPLRVAFRRFYSDGLAAGKFELALATPYRKPLTVGKQDAKSFVERFLNLPVRISQANGSFIESSLAQSGEHLAQSYLSATTRNRCPEELERWLVRTGPPLLFMECDSQDIMELPYFVRHVELPDEFDFELYHCLVPFRGGTIRMWLLEKYDHEHTVLDSNRLGASRRLRIYLQRLNAEHECLRLVLRNMMAKSLKVPPRSAASNALQYYLNEATKRIGVLEAKTSHQFDDDISNIARESMNLMNPGQLDALSRVLYSLDLRNNLLRKLEDYAEKWGSVTIIENVEQNQMGDVFKDINQSIIATRGSIADGVITLRESGNKQQIADAISQIDQLIADAPEVDLAPKKKKECEDLLNSITEEVNKKEPNKNVLRALGNTLFSIVSSVEPLAKATKGAFDILKVIWT